MSSEEGSITAHYKKTKAEQKAILSSQIRSVLKHGIPLKADSLSAEELWRKMASEYDLSALTAANVFPTVSEDAVCIISGMLSIELLVE